MRTKTIPVKDLTPANIVQQRAKGIDFETVNDYAIAMDRGDEFPPLDVFWDGSIYRIADGFHRHTAAEQAGVVDLRCRVHKGGESQAIVFACSANQKNGLRRTNADKRKAVETLLRVMPKRTSDRKIAELAGVVHKFVSQMRSELATVATPPKGGKQSKGTDYKGDVSVGVLPDEEAEEIDSQQDESNGARSSKSSKKQEPVEEDDQLSKEAVRAARKVDNLSSYLRSQPAILLKERPIADAIKRFKQTLRDMK